jgi:LuxR family transcriptional regulator, maltose regulon positive regulatory protein
MQTLGGFRLWRGAVEVLPADWRREKARKLFQLLLTYRKNSMDREQIAERLWPGMNPDTAQRDFKVALSSLFKVLEPAHCKDAPSAYIFRNGRLYGLRPGADIWIDVEQFESQVAEGDQAVTHKPQVAVDCYRRALQCTRVSFLQEYVYEEWCSQERERLLALYLRTADRLTRILVDQEQWEEVIEVCQAHPPGITAGRKLTGR